MAIRREQQERYGWWINELESLGLSVKKINEFNDLDEIPGLTDIIKQGTVCFLFIFQITNHPAVIRCSIFLFIFQITKKEHCPPGYIVMYYTH
jgi:hypothetical protein